MKKSSVLERKMTRINMRSYLLLGMLVMLLATGMFLYSILRDRYEDMTVVARSASELIQSSTDLSALVDATVEWERTAPESFRETLKEDAFVPEEDPSLFLRKENQAVTNIFLSLFRPNKNLSMLCLLVYDRETHIMALLNTVDRYDGEQNVAETVFWRPFGDDELEDVEKDRGSVLRNVISYIEMGFSEILFSWFEPVPYGDGTVEVYVQSEVSHRNVWPDVLAFVVLFSLTLLAAVVLLGQLFGRKVRRLIVTPVNAVAAAAAEYVSDHREGKPERAHFSALGVHTGDELEDLANAMSDMEREIGTYEKDLMRITAEQERISTELDLATRIQADMLPSVFPRFTGDERFAIAASMTPAKEVGGDFYDFFLIDRDHMALVVADVSGKGVPAALFMMISKTLLKNEAMHGAGPAAILSEVNAQLCENNQEMMFVTVWLGILDLKTWELTFADAGHENPLLYHEGKWTYVEKRNGIGLAMLEPELLELKMKGNPPFVDQKLQLAPGDILFQYTDGVTEAANASEEMFGEERLLEAMGRAPSTKPERLLEHLRENLEEFVGDAPQFDDITMLAIRVNDGEEKGSDG